MTRHGRCLASRHLAAILGMILCAVPALLAQDSASTGEWKLDAQGRRNPFDPVTEVPGDEQSRSREGMTREESEEILQRARLDLSTLGFLAAHSKRTLDQSIEMGRTFDELETSRARLVEGRAGDAALAKFDAILAKARTWWKPIDAVATRMEVLERRAQENLEEARRVHDLARLDAVRDLADEARKAAAGLPAGAAPEESARVSEPLARIEVLRHRAGVLAVEHLRVGDLLTGIIYALRKTEVPVRLGVDFLGRGAEAATTVQVYRAESQAILTGPGGSLTVRDGDSLSDIAPGLTLRRIERDGIVVSYRGEEVKVAMR